MGWEGREKGEEGHDKLKEKARKKKWLWIGMAEK